MVNDLDPARLRRLAELRPAGARVLSLYLDLDPTEFATAPARATEITSLLDQAGRLVEQAGLDHDALAAAREDVERAREFLEGDGLDASGARAIALFACGPAGVFETVRLPRPIPSTVQLEETPWITPLVDFGSDPRLAVALVDRHSLRLFHGTASSLEELNPDERSLREPIDAGHPHERRHPEAGAEEAEYHFARAGHVLFALLKTRGYDALVLGSRREERGAIVERLHPYVRERLAGEIDVDISSATADTVRTAAEGVLVERHAEQAGEALARLEQGLGRGERAAAGLRDVLPALNERRVETLLIAEGATLSGVICPRDGWLGADASSCPIDGEATERRDDVLEDAAAAAILQDARVLRVGERHGELPSPDGVAAVLRF